MRFVDRATLAIVDLRTVRERHTNVSIPADPTDEQLAVLGFARLVETPPPPHGPLQQVREAGADADFALVWVVEPLPDDQLLRLMQDTVQQVMDGQAISCGYDDIKSAVTYAEEFVVPKFQAEGAAFRAWRSLCWAACYKVLHDVNAGTRPCPTPEELIAELPALVLPE